MLSSKRKRTRATGVLGPIARILVIAVAVSAAGCSADVTRFDFSSKNTTSSIPVPPEPVRNGYGPSAAPRGLGLTEAPLPPSQPPDNYRMTSRPYDAPPSAPSFAERPPSARAAGGLSRRGRQYKTRRRRMRRSPNLRSTAAAPGRLSISLRLRLLATPSKSSTAKRSSASAAAMAFLSAAIKEANGLSSDTLRPGQRLVLPAGPQDRAPVGRRCRRRRSRPHRENRTAGIRSQAPPSLEPRPPATRRPAGRAATP